MATTAEMLEWGSERVRTRPWRGSDRVAELAPVPDAPLPSIGFLTHCLELLSGRGFGEVVTGALSPTEQGPFLDTGFEVRERLHLLSREMRDLPTPAADEGLVRRARRSDRLAVLHVDNLSFGPFWRFDGPSLDDAVAATPAARFRVAADPAGVEPVAGYAVAGRAGRRGYLQRLAVHPACQRRGLGSTLVVDALRWMRRWGVERVVVNTQLENTGALALYHHLGFRSEPQGLAVLSRSLP